MRAPSAGWRAAAERARRAGLIEPELRALYLLGRLHHDEGDLPRAVEVYREVIERSEVGGLTWSPYPAEARLLLAVALTHQGLLDEAWDLLDVSGQNPPMVYEWLYFAHQMLITIGIRGRRKEHALERLRDYWGTDGLTAISSGGAEIMRATTAGDGPRAMSVYDDVVAAVVPLWHEWFQARLRLATLTLAALAAAAPHQSAEERESAAHDVERLMADGARVIDFYAPYDGSHGPEYRMWVARRTAEHLRWRWLAQVDPPSADELVAAWRAAEETAVAYASVPEVAQTRVRLAGVLRAVGDAAGARTVADQARRGGPRARRPTDARRAHRPGVRARARHAAPRRRRSPRGRARSSPSSRRGAPTARSASSSSSAPRPCRSTSPTSWPSSRPRRAPRPRRWPVAAACSETRPRQAFVGPARG